MIKLSAITEMFKYHGDTLYKTNDLITEFDDSKDLTKELGIMGFLRLYWNVVAIKRKVVL